MIVVAGEALVDFTPANCQGHSGYLPHPGGSPYNVAIGLGRLEVPVAFLGRISRDPFGELLRSQLEASGVDCRYLIRGDEPTTLAFAHPRQDEVDYAFYNERTADRLLSLRDLPDSLPEGAALYFGSIALVAEPSASTLEALVRREAGRRLVSLDPNVRPALIADRGRYLERLRSLVAMADLVKVSQSDLSWLYPDRDPVHAAREWLSLGPAVVIVTRGAEGAVAVTRSGERSANAPRVSVVDTVGAGDAFASGVLAWLWRRGVLSRSGLEALDGELEAMLAFANRVAAISCTRPGANPPWRREVKELEPKQRAGSRKGACGFK